MNMQEEFKQLPDTPEIQEKRPDEVNGVSLQGHIKIFDPVTKEVFVNKRNAIHYENFSLALVNSIGNQGYGWVSKMAFGNGGSRVDPTGIITYLTPNSVGQNAALYNKTYEKSVDAASSANLDPTRNFMETRHLVGATYSDLLVSCLLDFGEPSGQLAFDNSSNLDGQYVFDELGLVGLDSTGNELLLTHVIFHPVQKSLNRMIQIDYTVRVQSISGVGA
jgi:hypothetical protein